MSMFRNLMSIPTESGPDTFICKIKNTENSAVTPYIAFPVRSTYADIPSITVTIETSSGQSQTLTITGADLTTENDSGYNKLGRREDFSAVSMAQDETATVTLYSKSKQFPSFSFCSSTSYRSGKANARLCEVNTPLPVFVDGYCGSVFVGSILTSFPNDLFQYGGSIKEMYFTFAYSSLVTVPADLFNGVAKVTTLQNLFDHSDKLATLPEGLFNGMTEVTNLSYCFNYCTALTSVPADLFSGMTKVTSLSNLFSYCTALTSVPEGLFSGMTEVTNLRNCLYNCTALTSVPASLFSGMAKVKDMYGLFMMCRSLTTIPEGIFSGLTNVTDLSSLFYECDSLTTIPDGVFSGMTEVTTLRYCFAYCAALTSVPASLFSGMAKVKDLNGLFVACRSLTTVPAGLFDGMTEVTDLSSMFSNCASLTSVPEGIFSSLTKATNLTNLFYNCTSLSTIPAGLFSELVNVTSFSYCFSRTSAKAIHANIFCDEATEKTTRFANATPNFRGCFVALTGTVAGTAPALWEYTYKAEPTKEKCFDGNSTTTLSNYDDIPTEWRS